MKWFLIVQSSVADECRVEEFTQEAPALRRLESFGPPGGTFNCRLIRGEDVTDGDASSFCQVQGYPDDKPTGYVVRVDVPGMCLYGWLAGWQGKPGRRPDPVLTNSRNSGALIYIDRADAVKEAYKVAVWERANRR